MMSSRHPFRWSLLAGLVVTLFGMASPATAQNYQPREGDNLVNLISVQAGGERVTPQNEPFGIGRIGVERCRELMGERVNFVYQLNPNFSFGTGQSGIQYDDVRLLEFFQETGIQGDCSRDGEQEACRQLDDESGEDPDDVILEPLPEGQFLTDRTITVSIDFETLLGFYDGNVEKCAFVSSDLGDDPGGPTQDAGIDDTGMVGDTGLGDAGMGDADAGTGMPDTGGEDNNNGGQTGGGSSDDPPAEADLFYVPRIFLTGVTASTGIGGGTEEEEVRADAPLLLDRTRPPAPTNVEAAATENLLKVRFTPPSDRTDIDNDYRVFYSNQPLPSGAPEELADRNTIASKALGTTNELDSGDLSAEVTGIDQEADDQLYVAVASEDRAENLSKLREADKTVDVQQSIDFWELYNEAGGQEPGGCACRQTGRLPVGFLLAVVSLGGLVVVRRRW